MRISALILIALVGSAMGQTIEILQPEPVSQKAIEGKVVQLWGGVRVVNEGPPLQLQLATVSAPPGWKVWFQPGENLSVPTSSATSPLEAGASIQVPSTVTLGNYSVSVTARLIRFNETGVASTILSRTLTWTIEVVDRFVVEPAVSTLSLGIQRSANAVLWVQNQEAGPVKLSVTATAPSGWKVTVVPSELLAQPNAGDTNVGSLLGYVPAYTLTVRIEAPETAAPGTYTIPIEVRGTRTDTGEPRQETVNLRVEVPILPSPPLPTPTAVPVVAVVPVPPSVPYPSPSPQPPVPSCQQVALGGRVLYVVDIDVPMKNSEFVVVAINGVGVFKGTVSAGERIKIPGTTLVDANINPRPGFTVTVESASKVLCKSWAEFPSDWELPSGSPSPTPDKAARERATEAREARSQGIPRFKQIGVEALQTDTITIYHRGGDVMPLDRINVKILKGTQSDYDQTQLLYLLPAGREGATLSRGDTMKITGIDTKNAATVEVNGVSTGAKPQGSIQLKMGDPVMISFHYNPPVGYPRGEIFLATISVGKPAEPPKPTLDECSSIAEQIESTIVLFGGQREHKTEIYFGNSGSEPYRVVLTTHKDYQGGSLVEIPDDQFTVNPSSTKINRPVFRVPQSAKEGDVFKAEIAAKISRPGKADCDFIFPYAVLLGAKDAPAPPKPVSPPFVPGPRPVAVATTVPVPKTTEPQTGSGAIPAELAGRFKVAIGAPTADSKLLADVGWVAMGSFAAPVEVDLGGTKVELELHMSQYAKAESLEKGVPTFLVLMKVGVPAAVSVDPNEVLDLLAGYLTGFALQTGAGSKPFQEVERTTVTAAGEKATARIYSSEMEGTKVKGLLAIWRSGSLLLGALAVGPEKDYGDIQELLAGSKLPKISATPGFEAAAGVLSLLLVGYIASRRRRGL